MTDKKLLIICGPTATGKTALALHMAKVFGGELVSADSRQVYRHMDIGTGKDIPKNFQCSMFNFQKTKNTPYYRNGNINLWGYDLVDPKEEFSVSRYLSIARKVINDIHTRGKLPIVVGGTGFYIKGIVEGIDTVRVPKNNTLRSLHQSKSVEELYTLLPKTDNKKALSLNESDRKNQRRLIRAIEIAKYPNTISSMSKPKHEIYNSLTIGLMLDRAGLKKRITLRVQSRIEQGFQEEVKYLLQNGVKGDMQSMQTPGYPEWIAYLKGELSREEAIERWIHREQRYAKRQITWFKKDKKTHWYNVLDTDFIEQIENNVRAWYANDRSGK